MCTVLVRDLSPFCYRMRAEFAEMPGLRLTLRQGRRLWDLDEALCRDALDVLIATGFLVYTDEGQYCRTDLFEDVEPAA